MSRMLILKAIWTVPMMLPMRWMKWALVTTVESRGVVLDLKHPLTIWSAKWTRQACKSMIKQTHGAELPYPEKSLSVQCIHIPSLSAEQSESRLLEILERQRIRWRKMKKRMLVGYAMAPLFTKMVAKVEWLTLVCTCNWTLGDASITQWSVTKWLLKKMEKRNATLICARCVSGGQFTVKRHKIPILHKSDQWTMK